MSGQDAGKAILEYGPRFCFSLALILWVYSGSKLALCICLVLQVIEAEIIAYTLRVHRKDINKSGGRGK